jgi:hypothetical protein
MRRDRNLFFVTVSLFAASLAVGCGGAGAPPAPAAAQAGEVGTISLPLVTETGGHRYRLRTASLYVWGPQFLQLTSSDDPGETALVATLQTGRYSASLYNWTLERDDGSGQFLPVEAVLLSSPSTGFSIFNGATTTLRFDFRTDGVIVRVGSGSLRVDVTVDEIAAICTPLAAADGCGAGTWCAPAGLTGLPLACVAKGTIELGVACLGAMDCVAGAACVDAGAGAVCTALCSSSEAGAPCPGGGTCQVVAADYGVCAP